MSTSDDVVYYRLRLGEGAALRGDRVICRWLGWAGAEEQLAHVRVIQSTVPAYRPGRSGLVPRDRLIRMQPRRAA